MVSGRTLETPHAGAAPSAALAPRKPTPRPQPTPPPRCASAASSSPSSREKTMPPCSVAQYELMKAGVTRLQPNSCTAVDTGSAQNVAMRSVAKWRLGGPSASSSAGSTISWRSSARAVLKSVT